MRLQNLFYFVKINIVMGVLTAGEIRQKIADIERHITVAQREESYTISSGLSSQSVKRQNLNALYKALDYWLKKLEEELLADMGCESFRAVPMGGWQR